MLTTSTTEESHFTSLIHIINHSKKQAQLLLSAAGWRGSRFARISKQLAAFCAAGVGVWCHGDLTFKSAQFKAFVFTSLKGKSTGMLTFSLTL